MQIHDIALDIRRSIENAETKIKVALLGRSGAGKSSLINALVGAPIAEIDIKTNTTTRAEFYEWNNLILVDLPGFDTESFPQATFFDDFDLGQFDIYLCVFAEKINNAEATLFKRVLSSSKPSILVRSKWDCAKQKGFTKDELAARVRVDIVSQLQTSLGVYFVSVDPEEGLNNLQFAISGKLEGVKGALWIKQAKAYSQAFLDQKKTECEKTVTLYAGLSAATALVPIPGAGVAVDLAALVRLFDLLRKSFGIQKVEPREIGIPVLQQAASRIINYATTEGAVLLLKRFATSETVKEVSKYVPFVGQVVAASLGFAITRAAGRAYLNDCYSLAQAELDKLVNLGYSP